MNTHEFAAKNKHERATIIVRIKKKTKKTLTTGRQQCDKIVFEFAITQN